MSIVEAFAWVSWIAAIFAAFAVVVLVAGLLVIVLPSLTFIAAEEKDWKMIGKFAVAWLAAFVAAVLLVWVGSHVDADAPWRWKA